GCRDTAVLLGDTFSLQRLGGAAATVALGNTLRLDRLCGRATGITVSVRVRDSGCGVGLSVLSDGVGLGIRNGADLGIQLLLAKPDALTCRHLLLCHDLLL